MGLIELNFIIRAGEGGHFNRLVGHEIVALVNQVLGHFCTVESGFIGRAVIGSCVVFESELTPGGGGSLGQTDELEGLVGGLGLLSSNSGGNGSFVEGDLGGGRLGLSAGLVVGVELEIGSVNISAIPSASSHFVVIGINESVGALSLEIWLGVNISLLIGTSPGGGGLGLEFDGTGSHGGGRCGSNEESEVFHFY